mmetsp:Transcript_35843/g.94181  ORF Transcript_35843/g.94181 Transcript_35843/m.94181 type:complete len:766 (-) Transcript_35843:77-2374(-)
MQNLKSWITQDLGPPEAPTVTNLDDKRQWLEDVEGESQLNWVKAKNAEALAMLGNPKEHPVHDRILSILDSKEKIPYIGRVFITPSGEKHYYNFWQDETNVRGLWRRCTLNEYRKPSPDWEPVLDLDVLSKEEGVTWVWGGSTPLDEGPDVPTDRCIIKLSRGGADAKVAREFDILAKRFVPESEGGFVTTEAKVSLCYKDRDTLLLGGSFFGNDALTDSGYPRTVHEWKRGTKLETAVRVFEGAAADVAVHGYSYLDRGTAYEFRVRALTFWTSYHELSLGGGAFAEIKVPEDAQVNTFADQLMITLRSEWHGFAAGSLLAAPVAQFMSTAVSGVKALLTPIFEPTPTCSLEGTTESRSYVILQILDNVRSELRFWKYDKGTRAWELRSTFKDDSLASISASGVKSDTSDDIWVTSSSYIQPTTYSLASAEAPTKQERLKALPTMYDASGCLVSQHEALSEDGTKVPYFLVRHKDMKLDGSTPTLLYGYGGFEISLTPSYIATVGVGWLEKGYAYVQANIRGGGEFGPTWHQAALKEKRHKAYEDFEAVGRDLVERGVTCASKLAVQGGSNGGLLVGNMLARSPQLFGAVVCQVPLLDMRRYNKLLAGASWVGEYGNPDVPEEWAYVQKISPYHTLQSDAVAPPTLFTTSTRDDRVHPGHARKLCGKMVDLGMPAIAYENIEGGHGGAADNKQRAFMSTLAWSFLERTIVNNQLSVRLASRSNCDGGRRPPSLLSLVAGPWLVPLLSAAALGVAIVAERRRCGR